MTEIEKFDLEVHGETTRIAGRMAYARAIDTAADLPTSIAPEFEWEMRTRDLPLLEAMISMPGAVPGVRVSGSIDPARIAQPIAAVRARIKTVWGGDWADPPSCRLHVEAVQTVFSDDDLRDGSSVTLLDVGVEGWRHLREVVGEAADDAVWIEDPPDSLPSHDEA